MEQATDDPLVGDELVQIVLDPKTVGIVFTRHRLEVGTRFFVRQGEDAATCIDPLDHSGGVIALWKMIDRQVRSVSWADPVSEIRLFIDGDGEIFIPEVRGVVRGSILGPRDTDYQDF